MFEVKKDTAFQAYFKLVDSADFATPENGVAGPTLTGAITKNGAAVAGFTTAAHDFTDHTARASGLYSVSVQSSHADTIGELVIAIADNGAGVAGCPRVFKVVSHPSDDIYDKVSVIDAAAKGISNVVINDIDPSVNGISNIVANAIDPGVDYLTTAVKGISNVINNTGVSLGANALAQVENSASAALQNLRLHTLLASQASLTVGSTTVLVSSVIGKILNKAPGTAWAYALATDSLEALRDNQAAAGGDWTANEKTEFKAILGIKNTGTPGDPTAGILFDDLLDGKVWDVLSTGHTGAGKAGRKLWHKVSMIQASIAQARTDIGTTDTRVKGVSDAVINNIDPSVNVISNYVKNNIEPTVNTISNAVRNIGVAVAGTAIANASSHLLHQAHVTIGQTGDFSTVAGSLRLARAGAIGDWTVAADALDVMDVDGTSQKSLGLLPGGGPYISRA